MSSICSGLVEELEAAREAFISSPIDGLAGPALGDRLVRLDAMVNRLRRSQAAHAVRFDALGRATADGSPSTAAWLRAFTTAAPAECGQLLRVGRALRDRLPNTSAALASEEVGWAAAQTIERGLRRTTRC